MIRNAALAAKGLVEYGDVILFIADVELRGGAIIVTAAGMGPAPEYHGPVHLYGRDGLLVAHGGRMDVAPAGCCDSILAEVVIDPGKEACPEAPA